MRVFPVSHHQDRPWAFRQQPERDELRTDGQAVVQVFGLEVQTMVGFSANHREAFYPGNLVGSYSAPQYGGLECLDAFSLSGGSFSHLAFEYSHDYKPRVFVPFSMARKVGQVGKYSPRAGLDQCPPLDPGRKVHHDKLTLTITALWHIVVRDYHVPVSLTSDSPT